MSRFTANTARQIRDTVVKEHRAAAGRIVRNIIVPLITELGAGKGSSEFHIPSNLIPGKVALRNAILDNLERRGFEVENRAGISGTFAIVRF